MKRCTPDDEIDYSVKKCQAFAAHSGADAFLTMLRSARCSTRPLSVTSTVAEEPGCYYCGAREITPAAPCEICHELACSVCTLGGSSTCLNCRNHDNRFSSPASNSSPNASSTQSLTVMTTYVKLVKGATKIKMAPPKAKYVDPILLGTADPHEFREIIRALDARVQDTAWTIVYKSLILAHLMIREGEPNVTIEYLSKHLEFFRLKDIFHSKLSSGDLQALRRYRDYLQCRCEQYAKTGKDYVRENSASLTAPAASDPQTSLDHVESLELQISALIKNRYSQYDLGNDLLLTAFRLMVQDLLVLYNSLNEGIITLLESFFELTHKSAERTLKLYKRFVELTENVVKYLKTGKAVGLKIPVIKHITTKLIRSLEEHLREDTNNRGQTFSSDGTKTPAQRELEQIREQKRILEEQIRTQQQMVISPAIPQQQTGYNPFTEGFSFEQPLGVQSTGNPFLNQPQASPQLQQATQTQEAFPELPQQYLQAQQTQQLAQQYTQQLPQQYQQQQFTQQATQQMPQQTAQLMPQQTAQQMPQQAIQQMPQQTAQQMPQQAPQQMPQQTAQQMPQQMPLQQPVQQTSQPFQYQNQADQFQPSPQLQSSHTGFYSVNTQVTPTYTGAGFGGYSSVAAPATGPAPAPAPAPIQTSMPTGSNNPFSLDNISKSNEGQARANPFSQTNQASTTNSNPFGAPMQSNRHTFGGLENTPTISVFPQTAQLQSHQNQPQMQPQLQQQYTQAQSQPAQQHPQLQPQLTQQLPNQFNSYGQAQPQGQPQQTQFNVYGQPQQPQQQYAQYPYHNEGTNLIDI